MEKTGGEEWDLSTGIQKTAAGRYPLLDTIRGATLVVMVAYHALWDAVNLGGWDLPWYDGWPGFLWQQAICWSFILLSGFCARLSRRPLRHAAKVFAAGVLVMAVTEIVMPEDAVRWGILTFLGLAAAVTWALGPLLERVPPVWGAVCSGVLFAATRQIDEGVLLGMEVLPESLYTTDALAVLGFPTPEFTSTDYFSLLPWIFLFWAGWFLFPLWKDRPILRRGRIRPLMWLGRRSLLLYLAHQPVLYGLMTAAEYLTK